MEHGQVIQLESLPGTIESWAYGINNAGQVVGASDVGGFAYATEWSNGQVINLGPVEAYSVNDAGQAVGYSIVGGVLSATEWSNGSTINLGGLLTEGSASVARGINDAGQVVGYSVIAALENPDYRATEWSDGQVIFLPNLPGASASGAEGINNAGQVVGTALHSPLSPSLNPPPG
jgi:probable HAF family extracellular repeat protein